MNATAAIEIAADHLTYGEGLIAKAERMAALAAKPGNKISEGFIYEIRTLQNDMSRLMVDLRDIAALGVDGGTVRTMRGMIANLARQIKNVGYAAKVASPA
jgi:hypothetical protein